jgi:hypothetical protein
VDALALRPMKDVVTCDKLRVAGTGDDPEISEWGNPTRLKLVILE